jgi:hypothetical protein
MLAFWQVATLMLVALGMAMSVAHALEMPGKMRLDREAYLTVQPIYYPGFTIGAGFGEFGAMVAVAALLFATPAGLPFELTLAALVAMVAAHAVYWIVTHPTNRFWLREQKLSGAGAAFFAVGRGDGNGERDWRMARKRWEYSHVARAVLHAAGLALLAGAVAVT